MSHSGKDLIEMVGNRFGRLVVVSRSSNDIHGRTRWVCKCDCGNETTVRGIHLRNERISSCGCLQKELLANKNRTHGLSHTTLYYVWQGMKRRCIDPNHKSYKIYGGRGIKLSNEWFEDYQRFHQWALENDYKKGLQIDRIDNNGDYSPANCRWVTPKVNRNNQRIVTRN